MFVPSLCVRASACTICKNMEKVLRSALRLNPRGVNLTKMTLQIHKSRLFSEFSAAFSATVCSSVRWPVSLPPQPPCHMVVASSAGAAPIICWRLQ